MSLRQAKPLGERSEKLQKEIRRCNHTTDLVWGVSVFDVIPEPHRPSSEDELSSRLVRGLRRLATLQPDLSVARTELLATRKHKLETSGGKVQHQRFVITRDVEDVIERYKGQGEPNLDDAGEAHRSWVQKSPKPRRVVTPMDIVKAAKRVPQFPGLEGSDARDKQRASLMVRAISPFNSCSKTNRNTHNDRSQSHATTPPPTSKIQRRRSILNPSLLDTLARPKRARDQVDPTDLDLSQYQKKHKPCETRSNGTALAHDRRSKSRTTRIPPHDRNNLASRILQDELMSITDFSKFRWPVQIQHSTEVRTWYLVNSAEELLPFIQTAFQKRMLLLGNQISNTHAPAALTEQCQHNHDEPQALASEAAIELLRPTQVAGLLDELEDDWSRKMLFVHDALLSNRQDVDDDQVQALRGFLTTFQNDCRAARRMFEHDCCAVGLLWTVNGPMITGQQALGVGRTGETLGMDTAVGHVYATQTGSVVDVSSDGSEFLVTKKAQVSRTEGPEIIDLCSSEDDVN